MEPKTPSRSSRTKGTAISASRKTPAHHTPTRQANETPSLAIETPGYRARLPPQEPKASTTGGLSKDESTTPLRPMQTPARRRRLWLPKSPVVESPTGGETSRQPIRLTRTPSWVPQNPEAAKPKTATMTDAATQTEVASQLETERTVAELRQELQDAHAQIRDLTAVAQAAEAKTQEPKGASK